MDTDDPTEPRLGARNPDAGDGRCSILLEGGARCPHRALQHVLYRDGDDAWASAVCHVHVPDSRRVAGYSDHHLWTRFKSSCGDPFPTWVSGSVPGVGHCEPQDRDETDAELAELLQHGTVPPKTDP